MRNEALAVSATTRYSYLTGEHRTSAELTAAEKDAISHRGKAVRAFITWLGEQR